MVLERPDPVVADDPDDRDAVPGHRVELHAGEPEGAVAEQQRDLAVGMGELGADRLAGAGAEAAVRAGVHPAAGLVGVDNLARVADEVAAVADHDRVAVEDVGELAVDPHRVQRGAVVVELGPLGLALLGSPARAGSRSTGLVRAGSAPVAAASRIAASVGRMPPTSSTSGLRLRESCVRRDVEPDQLRVIAEALTEAEPEVERQTDRQGDVGLLQPLAAGAAEGELVVGGEAAAAHPVEEDGGAELSASACSSSSPCAQYRPVPAMIAGRSARASSSAASSSDPAPRRREAIPRRPRPRPRPRMKTTSSG